MPDYTIYLILPDNSTLWNQCGFVLLKPAEGLEGLNHLPGLSKAWLPFIEIPNLPGDLEIFPGTLPARILGEAAYE